MPNDNTSFHQELSTPGGGTESELYRAIAPLIELDRLPTPKNNFEQAKLEKLKEDLRRGAVGLEYLTGLKNNKVETFYDRHPVQAVTDNILNNSGAVGLAVGAGIPALNFLRQARTNLHTEALDSRTGDPTQRAGTTRLSPRNSKSGVPLPTSPDVARVFGSGSVEDISMPASPRTRGGKTLSGIGNEGAIADRAAALDMAAGTGTKFSDELRAILTSKKLKPADKIMRVKAFLSESEKTPAFKNLGHFAELQRALEEKGHKIKGPIGGKTGDKILASKAFQELLNNPYALGDIEAGGADSGVLGKLKNLVNKGKGYARGLAVSAVPHSKRHVIDLADKHIGMDANNNLLHTLLKDHYGVKDNSTAGKALNTAMRYRNTPGTYGIPSRLAKHFGPYAAAGLGVYGAGKGLHALMKAIQEKMYGDEQIKEWKKNSLKSRGEFEEANRIK